MGNEQEPGNRTIDGTEAAPDPEHTGGSGGASKLADLTDGQSPRHANKLIAQMMRWQTEKTSGDLAKLTPKDLTARELAIAVTIRNMGHRDGRVSNGAVRNLISMEAQNQRDQTAKPAEGTEAGDVHLHLHDEQHIHVRERSANELVSRLRRVAGRTGEDGGAGPPGPGGDRAAD